ELDLEIAVDLPGDEVTGALVRDHGAVDHAPVGVADPIVLIDAGQIRPAAFAPHHVRATADGQRQNHRAEPFHETPSRVIGPRWQGYAFRRRGVHRRLSSAYTRAKGSYRRRRGGARARASI